MFDDQGYVQSIISQAGENATGLKVSTVLPLKTLHNTAQNERYRLMSRPILTFGIYPYKVK